MRASLGAKNYDGSTIIMDDIDMDENLIGSEFEDLVFNYKDERIGFCDFTQFVLACGELLHPCYHENVVEVKIVFKEREKIHDMSNISKVEILKFLNTMYWLSEYDQPNER